jgi:hypothetical protein
MNQPGYLFFVHRLLDCLGCPGLRAIPVSDSFWIHLKAPHNLPRHVFDECFLSAIILAQAKLLKTLFTPSLAANEK